MLGCWSLAAALASIWKRWRLSSSSVPSTVRVLTATSRSSTSSRPRYTMPMPPRPMRPTIEYLPILLRSRPDGSPAGSISSGVEPHQEDGDVVFAPARVGGGHERLCRLLDVALRLLDELADVLVGDHGGQAVRAEKEEVARLDLVLLHVDQQVRLAAQGPRDHVAQGMRAGLVRGDDPALDLLVDPAVVRRELADLTLAHEVDAAVPHVPDVGLVAVHQHRGHRGGHAL